MITNDNKYLLRDIGLVCLKFEKVFGKNSIYQKNVLNILKVKKVQIKLKQGI